MDLMLFDTLSRAIRPVRPLDGVKLRFYCCGPTVYGPAHIGNFRTFVMQDVFRRVVERLGLPTHHVRNVTDVDDKTIRQSMKEGKSLGEFTEFWLARFHIDCAALNLLKPHIEPSAVAHIPQQIGMIETLIEKGHAYQAADGSVYFKIASFKDYGRLSHLDERELRYGATVATDEYDDKEGVADFALWKARKPDDGPNYWPSRWGDGRPGWHLECSAMTREYLGETFDLHSGGVDLIFPHHENEIAQSECCTGVEMCRHWFHVTHLLVDGRKMSKSLGNLYTLDDLKARGHQPAAVRYVLLSGHYRQPLNFTLEQVAGAKSALEKLAKFEAEIAHQAGRPAAPMLAAPFQPAWDALLDDLNTPKALGQLFSTLNELDAATLPAATAGEVLDGLHFIVEAMGLTLPEIEDELPIEVPPDVRELAEKRWQARLARDWATSDELRRQLAARGWSVKDGRESYEMSRDA
jgi:cysteinyl-tRNA synthetase